MNERWPFVRRLLLALVLFCILGQYLAVGLEVVRSNANSSGFDQRSYLNLGLKIRAGKQLTDGNRHPLYPALLALFAQREWAYFTGGKLLSLALGALSLLLVFYLVKQLHGAEVALSVVFLMTLSPTYQRVTSHVMAESLLVGLYFMTWYLTVQGFEKQLVWIGAGAVAALAYLTKGTGQLLAMAFVVTVLLRYRRDIRGIWRGVAGYVVAYGLVAAPLWAHNLAEYGNPLYNYSTTHALWFDTWEDKYARGHLPTILSYLRSHSLTDILERQWRGLGHVIPAWVEAIAPRDSWWCWLALVMLLLTAALLQQRGTARHLRDRRGELLYSGLLLAIFYALFAWYADVYVAQRFFVPLAPLVYLYVTDGLAQVCRTTAGWLRQRVLFRPSLAQALYVLCCLGFALGAVTDKADAFRGVGRDPFAQDRERNAGADALFTWFRDNLPADVNFLWGPSTTLGSWRYEAEHDFEEIPSDVNSWVDLSAYVKEEECTYAIIDSHTYYRRQDLLSSYFTADRDLIGIQAIRPGWALTYVEPGLPCRWCVFQLLDQQPISRPLTLDLGDEIRLLGYDVVRTEVQAGEHVQFTLYWQPSVPVAESYTVFTHLLGPGNVLLSQVDRQPLRGRVPTERWLPGAIYADRFDMALPVGTPPGETRLAVGLYQLATMQRLPVVTADGQRLPEDRVLLPTPIIILPAPEDR